MADVRIVLFISAAKGLVELLADEVRALLGELAAGKHVLNLFAYTGAATVYAGKGGTVIFSNNFRRFEIDREALPEFVIEEITGQTISPDFERNRRIHNCWPLRRH